MDAGASLAPAAIDIELGQWIYTIPARPASDWIEAILDEDGGAIVPGLMDEDTAADIWREFLRGHITQQELQQAWRHALGAASGQPWWQCARLVMSAAEPSSWPIVHGKLTMRGVDLTKVSIGACYNAIWYIALTSCESAQERSQLEFQLTTPPVDVAPEEALSEFDVAGDFMAAMGAFQQLQGGAPAEPQTPR